MGRATIDVDVSVTVDEELLPGTVPALTERFPRIRELPTALERADLMDRWLAWTAS